MKISFILVYSSIQNMILMDPKSWSSKDSYYNKTILEFTKKILKQIDSLDINKEIILLDNSGDFPKEFYLPSLKVVPSIGAWNDKEIEDNKHLFNNIKDRIDLYDRGVGIKGSSQAEITALGFEHGLAVSSGDYFILQHNDTFYLDEYYKTEKFLKDVVNTLEENDYEYITIDKKPPKSTSPKEMKYFADCYWFLCRKDFYTKHNIWVDWSRGDNNHLATITCNNKNLKYLHLPGFYETFEHNKNYYKEQYPDLVGNVHFFNNIPFMTHMKGGTGLKRYDITNRGR